ncbi:MAG TPA: hypothetical protein VFC68_03310 [Treponemataceae bacterium]|nr:hypothetical protein [Treponemataceae bacterium]
MNKKLKAAIVFFVLSIAFISCAKNTAADSQVFNVIPKKTNTDGTSENTMFQKYPGIHFQSVLAEGSVAILFGSDFNSPEIVEKTSKTLLQTFGLTPKDQSLYLYSYPDDFKTGTYSRISLLPNKLESKNIILLLILGSPKQTHKILAELQDAERAYPVFSFFSLDDVLGTEAGSTAVIDMYVAPQDMLVQEPSGAFSGAIDDLIMPFIAGALQGWTDFSNIEYFVYVSDEIYKNTGYRLREYIDPETGIRSDNHYVLMQWE